MEKHEVIEIGSRITIPNFIYLYISFIFLVFTRLSSVAQHHIYTIFAWIYAELYVRIPDSFPQAEKVPLQHSDYITVTLNPQEYSRQITRL